MIDVTKKRAGLLVPVFALRRCGDLGIGDTRAVMDAISFCARNSISILQVLPINETGDDNSPYNAISSVALDPVLLTVEDGVVPGLNEKSLEQAEAALDALHGPVNYRQVKQLKLNLLQTAFNHFSQTDLVNGSSASEEFLQFKADQKDWLPAYTLFRTLMDVNDGKANWTQWADSQRNFEAAEIWMLSAAEQPMLALKRDFFAYVQWIAFKQWQAVRKFAYGLNVQLMGDIPFGISRNSADVWANQHLFDLEWSGGAPPEPFFKEDPFTAKWGQNWGIPLYNWQEHYAQGFKWWRQRVQKCAEIFHYFRVDHVLGFFRIYSFPWVPERNGEFLHLSHDEASKLAGGKLPQFKPRTDEQPDWACANNKDGRSLLQMLKDFAGDAGVIAEDLGMVPNYVRPTLTELGIPGFSIPYWERTADSELRPKDSLPSLNLATYATHDHQPMSVYYKQLTDKVRQIVIKNGLGSNEGWEIMLELQRLMRWLELDEHDPPLEFTPQLHEAFMKALLETSCWLAVFMITDLFGTKERFNLPGTCGQSNWSQRLEFSLADYETTLPYSGIISRFRQLVQQTGRI